MSLKSKGGGPVGGALGLDVLQADAGRERTAGSFLHWRSADRGFVIIVGAGEERVDDRAADQRCGEKECWKHGGDGRGPHIE